MNPDQLWKTTMNPKTRKINKITIDDVYTANEITSILMGNKVAPRKNFIKKESKHANIDL